MSVAIDNFIKVVSGLATQSGLQNIVIAVRDPAANEVKAVASPNAAADAGLVDAIVSRLGIDTGGADTGWDS